MKETVYYYRQLGTSQFIPSKTEKQIIPVRIKNDFFRENMIFDASQKLWQKTDTFPKETSELVPVEYCEFPIIPYRPHYSNNGVMPKNQVTSIEDLSAKNMADFLIWHEEEHRYSYNLKNYVDENSIIKDYFCFIVNIDYEQLILTISIKKFARKETENRYWNFVDSEIQSRQFPSYSDSICEPIFDTQLLTFDIKNGKINFDFDEKYLLNITVVDSELELDLDNINPKVHKKFNTFSKIKHFLLQLEKRIIPEEIIKDIYPKFLELVKIFTGLKTINEPAKSISENTFVKMLYLTLIPYEPNLCSILPEKEMQELKIRFNYKRTDPNVLNRFLKKAKINGYRIFRRVYNECPNVIFVYRKLWDCGFRDFNLYNSVFENTEKRNCISLSNWKNLVFFSKYSIKKRGEKATLNTIFKSYSYLDTLFVYNDTINMFHKYFRYIPQSLRKDILKNGFSEFNHDALSNISFRVKNRNYTFKYTEEQKKLEDKIDGYSFCLPKDSWQLCEIGTALHNCVASYVDDVREKRSTIVYATKDDEYKLCIEVSKNEIRQERADRNASPSKAEKEILAKWHERHKLTVNN